MHPPNNPIERSSLESSDIKNQLNTGKKEDKTELGPYGEMVLSAVKKYIVQLEKRSMCTPGQGCSQFFKGLEGLVDMVCVNTDDLLSNDDEERLPDEHEATLSKNAKDTPSEHVKDN